MLIKKIIQYRTRNGILAFFIGLGIAVVSLYMDVIRGASSGTIGLYQVVGALTGYTIAGIGAIMVMNQSKLRRVMQKILFYSGFIIVAISLLADHIGIAGEPGFDKFQGVGTLVGLIIVSVGFYVRPFRIKV